MIKPFKRDLHFRENDWASWKSQKAEHNVEWVQHRDVTLDRPDAKQRALPNAEGKKLALNTEAPR